MLPHVAVANDRCVGANDQLFRFSLFLGVAQYMRAKHEILPWEISERALERNCKNAEELKGTWIE